MTAGRERDALVTAALTLRMLARKASLEGARHTAGEAIAAAKRIEGLLNAGGCPGCGGPVVQISKVGRPRRWCLKCSPRKTRGKLTVTDRLAS